MGRIVAFLGMAAQVFACESVYFPPCVAGTSAEIVFVGTAIDNGKSNRAFRFRIDETLKGIPKGTKEIEVGPGPCNSGYSPNQQYLIVGSRLENEPDIPGFSHGEPLESAAESLALFRALGR